MILQVSLQGSAGGKTAHGLSVASRAVVYLLSLQREVLVPLPLLPTRPPQ